MDLLVFNFSFETLPANFAYLFSAYTAIWIILFTYLLRLMRKERLLRQQLEAIAADIQNKDGTTDV